MNSVSSQTRHINWFIPFRFYRVRIVQRLHKARPKWREIRRRTTNTFHIPSIGERERARPVFCLFLFFPFFILFSKRSESECADFQWQTASHSNLIRHKVQLDGCVAVASGSCLFSHHSKWINLKNKHILMSSPSLSLFLSRGAPQEQRIEMGKGRGGIIIR